MGGLVDYRIFDSRTNGVYHDILCVLLRGDDDGIRHDDVDAVQGVDGKSPVQGDDEVDHSEPTRKADGYLRAVIEERDRRELLLVLTKVSEEISAGHKHAREAISEITSFKLKAEVKAETLSDHIDHSIKELKEFAEAGSEISFGIPTLDKNYSMRRGNLLVVGAPTSHGKTAFVTSAITCRALLQADRKHAGGMRKPPLRVLFNCHEDYHVYPLKLASSLFSHPLNDFVNPYRLSPDAREEVLTKLELSKGYSDRLVVTPGITIPELSKVADGFKPDVIILDYLQKHVESHFGDSQKREYCGKVTSEFQDLVRKHRAYGVLTSQIRRREYAKIDKASFSGVLRKPGLSDLKESGDIENYADSVMILWWPWRDLNTEQTTGVDKSRYIIQVAKDKLGPGCEVECKFDGATLSFEDKFKI